MTELDAIRARQPEYAEQASGWIEAPALQALLGQSMRDTAALLDVIQEYGLAHDRGCFLAMTEGADCVCGADDAMEQISAGVDK